MFPTTEKVKLDTTEVLCMDMTYGYILGLENGTIEETQIGVVLDGTDLAVDEIMRLRKHEVLSLYNTVVKLTYPHMYNEDGTIKDIPPDEQETKKKV